MERIRNEKGMTLIELVVSLLIAAIVFMAASTFLFSSTNFFSKTTNDDLDKMVSDQVYRLISDEIREADYFEISDVEKTLEANMHEFKVSDGKLFWDKKQAFNNDVYHNHQVKIKAKKIDATKIQLIVEMIRDNELSYSRKGSFNFRNIELLVNKNESTGIVAKDMVEIENCFLYYKSENVEVIEYTGTVEDEKYCKDSNNDKGPYNYNSTYKKGDFVTYQGEWYRAVMDITNVNQKPQTGFGWKKIKKTWDKKSSYLMGDVVMFENQYYECLVNLYKPTGNNPPATNDDWQLIDKPVIDDDYIAKVCRVEVIEYSGTVEDEKYCKNSINDKGQYNKKNKYEEGDFVLFNDILYRVTNEDEANSKGGPNNPGWKRIDKNYNLGSSYLEDDVVIYQNIYYECILDNFLIKPTNTTYWKKLYVPPSPDINEICDY
ncbi:MAG: prepilin-type N-terminal cleavage/methylation domain-containing protein [Erysipelotrichaceae bacterium]